MANAACVTSEIDCEAVEGSHARPTQLDGRAIHGSWRKGVVRVCALLRNKFLLVNQPLVRKRKAEPPSQWAAKVEAMQRNTLQMAHSTCCSTTATATSVGSLTFKCAGQECECVADSTCLPVVRILHHFVLPMVRGAKGRSRKKTFAVPTASTT
jgi:hypothetical protein